MSPTLHFVASIRWQIRGRNLQVGDKHTVIAFSLPNCKSEFTGALCLIADLTCQMRRAPWITCQNNSTNKRQTPWLLDVELQTPGPSWIQMERLRKSPVAPVRRWGEWEQSASGYQAALFSLGEMGAWALQTRWQYLAFIGFLIKFV